MMFSAKLRRAALALAGCLIFGLGQAWAQGDVIVQVMAGQDQAAAGREAARLEGLGIPSFQRAEEVPGKGLWHRVYVGPFDTEAEGKAAAEQLKADGTISSYIVRRDGGQTAAAAPPAAQDGVPVIGGPAPASGGDSAPVMGGEAIPPPPLPLAQTPTYGEPVSPEQAAQLGLTQTVPVTPAPGSAGAGQGLAAQETWPMTGGGSSLASPAPAAPEPVTMPAPAPEPAPLAAPEPAPAAPAPVPAKSQGGVIPAKPTGPMKIQGFTMVVDLSSSMRNLAPCAGRIKEEAVAGLLRKMNQRIPSHPYRAVLRVFGYKQSWTRKDYTTTYFGPDAYDRDRLESAIARLAAADSVSPFDSALNASNAELSTMEDPKAVLMFADFEVNSNPGGPVAAVKDALRRYGQGLKVYTFYITRQSAGERLAKDIAAAGQGKAYNICTLLDNDQAFEAMMMEIFGPSDEPACDDRDEDGVCDSRDLCPNTPKGAPVDERGCWVAAYSQFFDFDKAVVKSAFYPRLEHAAKILLDNPGLPVITIAGHTDNVGADAYNLDLGRRRAEAVRDLMIKYGTPPERMVVESFGKSRPIAPNDTEEGRAKNRRVEFHVGDVPPAQ